MGRGGAQSGVGVDPADLDGGTFILTGPARCGKTEAALAVYERHVDEMGRGGCLMLVPNAPAVAQVRDRLLARSESGVVIAPAVTTFSSLAAGVLAGAGAAAGTLSAVGRHLLLTRIIAEMAAEGAFKALGPLADTPGLVDAMDASIAELKRAAIDPAELGRVIDPRSHKDADLLEVYRRYQQSLHKTGRFDVEGQMWQARDVLAGDGEAPLGFDRVEAIVVDGFTDFTPTQAQMLALLAPRVRTMLITLPTVDQPRRRRLWFWTRRTLERLVAVLPDAAVIEADPSGDPMPDLFDLAGGDGDGAAQPGHGRGMTIIAAADPEAEIRAVARLVKADLLAGVGSVAVLARGLEAYGESAPRVFADHGIPLARRPRPLAECNVVRYVLSVLSLWPDFEFHSLAAVIRSSYFRPSAVGEGFDEATSAGAEMALRVANVPGGRDACVEAVRRLARKARMPHSADADEDTVQLGPMAVAADDLDRAGDMLEALMARLDRLAECRDLAGYAAAAASLIAELEVEAAARSGADDEIVAADLRALRAFEALLEEVAEVGMPLPSRDAPTMALLLARAANVASAPAARVSSPVTLLDVMDARALRFERVYVLGMNEKAFPRLAPERCFIDEADREAWAGRGVVLDRRSDLIGREMLLMYLAATRGEEGLTVSHLTADGSGRIAAPSVFLEELESAARRQGMPVERKVIAPGRFVPSAGELATPSDTASAAVLAAFDGSERTKTELEADAPELLAAARAHDGGALARASFGILAAHRRWREAAPDAFDGRLDDPALLAVLADRIPDQWVFSASELNSFARCPWQFFARYLLGLRPLVAPELAMTPADRGSFCHDVLWRTFTDLRGRHGAPVNLARIPPEQIDEALDAAAEAERERLAEVAVHSRLWDKQTRFWTSLLRTYLAGQREAARDAADGEGALYFELAFGMAGAPAERIDPASLDKPVSVDVGGVRIRVRGKIDRVDCTGGLLAVDYKTGVMPSLTSIREGVDLQLALYAGVLAEGFGRRVRGGAYHDVRNSTHRYFADFKLSRGKRVAVDDFADQLAVAMAAAGACVAGMAAGRFDALPRHGCASWCPYRQICHYSEHRARRKADESAEGGADE